MLMPNRFVVASCLILAGWVSSAVVVSAQSPIRSRAELLSDPSDAGIGLSLGRYRDYQPADDLQARRNRLADQGLIHPGFGRRGFVGPPLEYRDLQVFPIDMGRLLYDPWYASGYSYLNGYRLGEIRRPRPVQRSPIYDWQAPVVGQFYGQSFIRPGFFWDSNSWDRYQGVGSWNSQPSGLWHP